MTSALDERAAIASHSTATTDTPWDGPAAEAAAPNDAAVLTYMHAWRDSQGDPTAKSTYKFPHHKPGTNTPANLAGCRNGLARLSGANIPDADRAGVERHLRRHLNDGNSSAGANAHAAAHLRAAAGGSTRRSGDAVPGGAARSLTFPAVELRNELVQRDGQDFRRLDGYASIVERGYEMWDVFGPYEEIIDARAFDETLAANPDVAFLVNHRGLSMARTTNGTLTLSVDATGLHSSAYLNPKRTDVRDLLVAIDDKTVTEMSFAFMLEDGEFNDDFDEFRITKVNLNRGDVSAVNYGANPYTSIAARSREIMSELDHLPAGAARAALGRLQQRLDGAVDGDEPAVQERADTSQVEVLSRQIADGNGRKIAFVEALLEI